MDVLGLNTEQWQQVGIALILVVASALIVRVLLGTLVDRLMRWVVGDTGERLSALVLKPLRGPLSLAAIVVALSFGAQRLRFLFDPAELEEVFFALYVLAGLLVAIRLVGGLLAWYSEEVAPRTETKLDEQLLPFARRVAVIALIIIGLIILLSRFDVDVSGLVATLGIGSLAIALAAQASLSDVISGFIIMFDRPYRIGDRVEIQDLDTWGDVLDIGLRSTRVRTRDNRMVIVPNSVMGKSLIVNYSYPDTQYRIEIELGLAYGTDIELARRTLIEAVEQVPGVLPDRPVEALFLRFGESAMIFRVRWWLESYVDTRRMFDSVNTAMYQALAEVGIEIPNVIRDLNHRFEEREIRKLAAALRGV